MGLREYPKATWFISPNQEQASVMFSGFGNSFMATSNFCDGAMPVGVIFNPANSTVCQQNLNLLALITIPLSAHSCKKSHT